MTGPLAAVALLTDGLEACLTASKRPHFGWELEAGAGSDPAFSYQTAYQLRLSDAGGAQLWDSGIVVSRQQHYVVYGGPELAPDADFRWTVRVHDAAGVPGHWSPPQEFSTGLDAPDWDAEWICRQPGGRAPLEVFDGALRVAGSPYLPLPCPPVRRVRLEVRLRPVMGWAGVLLRATGPGTGLLLELDSAGSVVLRRAAQWEIPSPAVPATEILASARLDRPAKAGQERLPGKDLVPGCWHDLAVTDDGRSVAVTLDGVGLFSADVPAPAGFRGSLALHQGPRSQAEYASFLVTDSTPGVMAGGNRSTAGAALLNHRFDAGAGRARACLDEWTRTTTHRQPDEWTLARTDVTLSGNVVRARLFAAASHQAEFRIDGATCLETSSFGYPGEGYYDAADVTALLQAEPGQNGRRGAVLSARVHWYGPGQGRAAGVPGLLAQLHVDYDDGRREVFGSGPDWQVAEGPYRQSGYRNDEGDPVEHLDATAPGAPQAPGSATWEQATTLGRHPVADFPAIRPRRTFLARTPSAAARLLTARDGTVVADFGRVLPARPVVDFSAGQAGRTVMIRAGYTLAPDGRVDRGKSASQNTDMSFPYTQADGPQRYEAAVHLGFRYLEVPGIPADEITAAGAVVVHSGHSREGSFSSSDPVLDAVFTLLRDSALYGAQEQFVDTPTREKGQFLGDAVNISYATMALFGERNLTAQALREFAASATRYWSDGDDHGRYNAVYPNGDGKRDIPDFSLMMPEWVEDYHRNSGDTALVEELLPALRATAGYVLRHIAVDGPTAGLITCLGGGSGPYLHGIVDWPAPGRFGYDMECAAKTTVNAQAVSVLDAVAGLCEVTGRTREAAGYRSHSADLAAAINARLRVDGVMVDGLKPDGSPTGHASQHATSFPLSLGITPAEWVQRDGRRLAGMGMRQGPMTVHRLVRALLAAGLVDDVLDLLTDSGQPGWARLLASGASFTWEAWELDEDTDYSQSHAWSASVIREILAHLLGIRVTAGGAEVSVEPPACRLEHARGSVPLQRGTVSASWRRGPAGTELSCTVPAGVRAVVVLPAGRYAVEGPTPGAAAVEFSTGAGAGTVRFRIHPGTWHFRPE
ncbi:family 78 glycoside hydrolase catalytic domain [Arthrobacter oryzae]|uniref:family 78 glycoside hydrolase catalytic domain n=1 Tax=Arthrobacter oryzae TaxID=409290 RepID=UPI00273BF407|nr:family 78 glycoside hydrolase catalytic domain [Arthrobacter oryzae]WLQ07242.1 family 78 glycoside hydrolase catalytic domain [Arthrobacter oryzae]